VTEQTTRLVLPSHIEAVADAAAAAADFARNCGLADEAAFGIDMAVREAITNAIVHGNKEDDTKAVEVTFNCGSRAVEIEVTAVVVAGGERAAFVAVGARSRVGRRLVEDVSRGGRTDGAGKYLEDFRAR